MDEQIVPSIDGMRPVVLRVLSDGSERYRHDIAEQAADLLQLSPHARDQRVPSGEHTYAYRVGWALSGLKQAGLLHQPKRGWYQITDDGRAVDARGLERYSEIDMREWPAWRAYKNELAERKTTITGTMTDSDSGEDRDPVELMVATQQEFNAEVETSLRRRLQEASPEFFEKAVIDLLWAMGYGGSHGSKQHLGQSGDGGIDGVIRQDALGLSKVYIQAKRYADTNTVGSGEIRNFIGALDSKGASHGVFITTSRFAPAAITTARDYRHGTLILIDGIELTTLMLSYEVAVQKHRTFTLYEIDEDFFE